MSIFILFWILITSSNNYKTIQVRELTVLFVIAILCVLTVELESYSIDFFFVCRGNHFLQLSRSFCLIYLSLCHECLQCTERKVIGFSYRRVKSEYSMVKLYEKPMILIGKSYPNSPLEVPMSPIRKTVKAYRNSRLATPTRTIGKSIPYLNSFW